VVSVIGLLITREALDEFAVAKLDEGCQGPLRSEIDSGSCSADGIRSETSQFHFVIASIKEEKPLRIKTAYSHQIPLGPSCEFQTVLPLFRRRTKYFDSTPPKPSVNLKQKVIEACLLIRKRYLSIFIKPGKKIEAAFRDSWTPQFLLRPFGMILNQGHEIFVGFYCETCGYIRVINEAAAVIIDFEISRRFIFLQSMCASGNHGNAGDDTDWRIPSVPKLTDPTIARLILKVKDNDFFCQLVM
jgi:hypothetical protein